MRQTRVRLPTRNRRPVRDPRQLGGGHGIVAGVNSFGELTRTSLPSD